MEPPPFRGGIVADPMGLGKTLTMIALAATDLDPATEKRSQNMSEDSNEQHWNHATLIIVPPPRKPPPELEF